MGTWGKAAVCLIWAIPCTVGATAKLVFNDPLADRQAYHDQSRFGEAWGAIYDRPRRGQVKVAVLDSGFQVDHPDLQANLIRGINIVNGSSDVSPVHPHGTGTSGIPGAHSGNDTGISQTAFTANVLPVRISNRADGAAFLSDITRAIRFAADGGARVINISYGGVGNRSVAKAARYAYQKGALVFMAAGNSGTRTRWRNYRHLIAVGSIDGGGQRSSFSTYGRFVDFVAPGEDVTTLFTDDQYADWSGTSFSSPIAASVAALVFTANPYLSPKQALKIMAKTAMDKGRKGRDIEYGYGLPDAKAAVDLAFRVKGRYRRRYARRGIDPFVENDWSDLSGLLDIDSFGMEPDRSLGLALPQGFLSPQVAIQNVPIPEPATVVLLILGMVLLSSRSRRDRILALSSCRLVDDEARRARTLHRVPSSWPRIR